MFPVSFSELLFEHLDELVPDGRLQLQIGQSGVGAHHDFVDRLADAPPLFLVRNEKATSLLFLDAISVDHRRLDAVWIFA